MDQILDHLAVSDQLRAAVTDHDGPLGIILADALAWETGTVQAGLLSGVEAKTAEGQYLAALTWAVELCRPLESAPNS